MTESEAIKAIEYNRPTSGYYILNEALDMAISALESQMLQKAYDGDDLISKSELLKKIEETAIQVEKKYHGKRYGETLAQGYLSGLAVVREEIIRNPAVYNLDALVKRLEKEKFIQQETVLSDVHQGYNAGLSRAIEILKKG